ncbi:MAG: hypothetical protein ABIN05_07955 [candidate division WOR-3 bacterium]
MQETKRKMLEELDKEYKKYWDDYKNAPENVKSHIDGIMKGIGISRKIIEKWLK